MLAPGISADVLVAIREIEVMGLFGPRYSAAEAAVVGYKVEPFA